MQRSIEEEQFLDKVRRLAAGKMTSSTLELAFELDVFGKLEGKEVTLDELAALLGLPWSSARMLAQFLCREELLVQRDGKLSSARWVEPNLVGDAVEGRAIRRILQVDLPMEALKHRLFHPPVLHWYQIRDEGEIVDTSSMVDQKAEGWFASFQTNTHPMRIQWGEDLAGRYDFSAHHTLLDVGGGTGGWCVGVRRHNPSLRCRVFDLPEVQEIAEEKLAADGETEQVEFVPGSFFSDELPSGADVVLLASVVHNWTPEDGRTILGKVFDALEPGGTVLVHEYFFEDDWTGTMEAVFEAFVLLGPEGRSGWQPTYQEAEDLLTEAGFIEPERRHNLVIARKP